MNDLICATCTKHELLFLFFIQLLYAVRFAVKCSADLI